MVVTRKEIAAKRALIDAIEIGDVRAVRKYLDNGCDPNATEKDDVDGSQHSLLILAICQHQFEVAKELVNRGADVSTVYLNYDAIHACIYRISAHKAAKMIYEETLDSKINEILKLVDEELKKSEGKEKRRIMPSNLPVVSQLPAQVLIDAVNEGDIECIHLLLDYGMDINVIYRDRTTNKQQSVLMFAILVNEVDTARMLIERGAELDTVFQNNDPNDGSMLEATALQTARACMEKYQTKNMEQLVELISTELMKKMGKRPRIVEAFTGNAFRTDSSMSGHCADNRHPDAFGSQMSLRTTDLDDTTKSATCVIL